MVKTHGIVGYLIKKVDLFFHYLSNVNRVIIGSVKIIYPPQISVYIVRKLIQRSLSLVLVVGIDIGSLTGKIVVLTVESNGIRQKFSYIKRVGYNPSAVANELINLAKKTLNVEKEDFDYIISTG